MSNLSQKIETIANVGIIAVAILLIAFIVQKTFSSNTQTAPQIGHTAPLIGTKVELADYSFSESKKTVLLVLSENCKYCVASMPFYKRLLEQSKINGVRVVATFSSKKEIAEKYLLEQGLSGIEVRQSLHDKPQISATPTLLIVRQTGEIDNVWVGKLTPQREDEVLTQVQSK